MSQRLHNTADLDRAAEAGLATLYPERLRILIGSASCGLAMGAGKVEAAAARAVEELGLDAAVCKTGCIGFCAREPLVDLMLPNGPRVSFGNMTPDKTRALLEAYAAGKPLPVDQALGRFDSETHVSTGQIHHYMPSGNGLNAIPEWSTLDFYRRQKKVILRNCGSIDPMSINEAIARGAYRGALRALTGMTAEQVIDDVVASGLRGRGGAAFPTGKKWQLARQAAGDRKYVVCNADEGAPGAYMDRSVLEGDPHAVLEGMIIGAHAIGATEGFIYVRSEYPLAITILCHAIAEAEKHGLLGDDIFGSGFSLRIRLRCGAGAYVCGEETALIESIEGHAGEPRSRPPYPVQAGLWGRPTVVNNVKTWASVAPIITRGPAWYAAMGTPNMPGTTVLSLEGAVKNAGLVEVPFGITLRELIEDIGGGVVGDRPLKAVQVGGPSRGCIPASMLDLPFDADGGGTNAAIAGTGGVIVLDDSACVVDMTRFLLGFFMDESCGKCVPCREGTKHMLRLLNRMCVCQAAVDDLALLERLAGVVKNTAQCGLGSMAPIPVLTALRHFRPEFEAHVRDKRCPAGACSRQGARSDSRKV